MNHFAARYLIRSLPAHAFSDRAREAVLLEYAAILARVAVSLRLLHRTRPYYSHQRQGSNLPISNPPGATLGSRDVLQGALLLQTEAALKPVVGEHARNVEGNDQLAHRAPKNEERSARTHPTYSSTMFPCLLSHNITLQYQRLPRATERGRRCSRRPAPS